MAAAWVVKQKFPEAKLIPAQYGDKAQETSLLQDCYENAIINEHIIVVDFSFPRELMDLIYSKARKFTVLDHHKTAEANCKDAPYATFDMNKSGAGLAWDYYFPSEARPYLVDYVEDRDLWRFKLDESHHVNAYIQSFPITLDDYEYINDTLENGSLDRVVDIGNGIERYKNTMVEAICKHARLDFIGNFWVPIVQSSILMSEIGHYLCQQEFEYPDPRDNTTYRAKPVFAGSYFVRAKDDCKVYSLRSIGEFDVSGIAKIYGGGGHRNAAGFQLQPASVLGEAKR
jgi:oligoribonuclease NrnB/cAMP/cGMP phosphodiesterase (DHH superfamily)